MVEDENRLERFGTGEDMTTYQYVKWLGTEEGRKFLETRSSDISGIGDYFAMHVSKSELITGYASFYEEE